MFSLMFMFGFGLLYNCCQCYTVDLSAYSLVKYLDHDCNGPDNDVCIVIANGQATYYAFDKPNEHIVRLEFNRLENGSVIDVRNLHHLQQISIDSAIFDECPLRLTLHQWKTVAVYVSQQRVSLPQCTFTENEATSVSTIGQRETETTNAFVTSADTVSITSASASSFDPSITSAIASSSSPSITSAIASSSGPSITTVITSSSSPSITSGIVSSFGPSSTASDVTANDGLTNSAITDTTLASATSSPIVSSTSSTCITPGIQDLKSPTQVTDIYSGPLIGVAITAGVCFVAFIILLICHWLKVIKIKKLRLGDSVTLDFASTPNTTTTTETSFSTGSVSPNDPSVFQPLTSSSTPAHPYSTRYQKRLLNTNV